MKMKHMEETEGRKRQKCKKNWAVEKAPMEEGKKETKFKEEHERMKRNREGVEEKEE